MTKGFIDKRHKQNENQYECMLERVSVICVYNMYTEKERELNVLSLDTVVVAQP